MKPTSTIARAVRIGRPPPEPTPPPPAPPPWAPPTPAEFCQFRHTTPRDAWTVHPPRVPWKNGRLVTVLVPQGAPSRRTYGPNSVDAPVRNQPVRRCPLCRRRLTMRVVHCIGGEFICWVIPEHKPRETRAPGPRRMSRQPRRGT